MLHLRGLSRGRAGVRREAPAALARTLEGRKQLRRHLLLAAHHAGQLDRAVVCAGVLVFRETAPFERLFSEIARSKHAWGFAKLLAATAAPVVVSLLVIHEIKRREARYDEMESSLQELAERIGRVRSLTALREAVVDTEHMLLSECYEWWVLAKANVAA